MTLAMKSAATRVLALSLVLLSGCASESFTSSTSKQYPPWRGEVTVLEKLPVAGSYDLIGVVTIEGSRITSDDRMYAQMKEQAAARGANAVVPQSKIKIRTGSKEQILAAYAIWLRK